MLKQNHIFNKNFLFLQALKLYKFPKPNILTEEGARLPEAFKKFYREWKFTTPSPVHYQENQSKWVRNEVTGEVKIVQNIPIPLLFPPESHQGIWGGEGVIKGFQKRQRLKQRVPHFWVPNLKKSAIYSEILNITMSVTVTERTIDLIIENKGFDNYILGTKACDLQSSLALKLKQKMLKALYLKDLYNDDPLKKEEVYNKYKHFLEGYTEEDIEWYGLTIDEALRKMEAIEKDKRTDKPLKVVFRQELLSQLMEQHEMQSLKPKEEEGT
ncbi:hypothetical protein AAG570_006713 [Ranatra chinensis]|uniref:Large ribosomal subunit protein bL28m n=1 Tax=Ranatra chinensis TaxID=642074 RepID=A0ABD0YV50_9HEMI